MIIQAHGISVLGSSMSKEPKQAYFIRVGARRATHGSERKYLSNSEETRLLRPGGIISELEGLVLF